MKVFTVCLVLPLMSLFEDVILALSPSDAQARQVANAHSYFNCLIAIVSKLVRARQIFFSCSLSLLSRLI
jgi:Na+/phosphate symporter